MFLFTTQFTSMHNRLVGKSGTVPLVPTWPSMESLGSVGRKQNTYDNCFFNLEYWFCHSITATRRHLAAPSAYRYMQSSLAAIGDYIILFSDYVNNSKNVVNKGTIAVSKWIPYPVSTHEKLTKTELSTMNFGESWLTNKKKRRSRRVNVTL